MIAVFLIEAWKAIARICYNFYMPRITWLLRFVKADLRFFLIPCLIQILNSRFWKTWGVRNWINYVFRFSLLQTSIVSSVFAGSWFTRAWREHVSFPM